jgi:hypothetical protein
MLTSTYNFITCRTEEKYRKKQGRLILQKFIKQIKRAYSCNLEGGRGGVCLLKRKKKYLFIPGQYSPQFLLSDPPIVLPLHYNACYHKKQAYLVQIPSTAVSVFDLHSGEDAPKPNV